MVSPDGPAGTRERASWLDSTQNNHEPISFDAGIPFSAKNAAAYGALYVLEQWLRRVAYAALAAKVGPHVLGALPAKLCEDLKRRLKDIPGRVHLGAETADEFLWMTTLEELRDLLLSDTIFPVVRRLTGYDRQVLTWKLSEIREIRNVIGHNRAVSRTTLTILEADLLSVEHGLQTFRHEVLRNRTAEIGHVTSALANTLDSYLTKQVRRLKPPVPKSGLGLTESEDFVFAIMVPRYLRDEVWQGERELGIWVDTELALAQFSSVRKTILGVTVPIRGTGFGLIWPKVASEDEHREVVTAFVESLDKIWCNEDYGFQDEQFLCHPKIWFQTDH